MKSALFGGSFNPPHVGHLIVAEAALAALGVDQIVFVPAGEPPHKQLSSLAPASRRLEMTRLALEGNDRFGLWDYETRVQGTSYTIETVRRWKSLHTVEGAVDFLIGADTIWELHTWKAIDRLFDECRFTPFVRPGAEIAFPEKLGERVAEGKVRAMLDRVVRIPLVDVSATEMRRRVAAGTSIRYLTPDSVKCYIEKHGLYREADGDSGRRACRNSTIALGKQTNQ